MTTSYVYLPKTKEVPVNIKWFDDSKLIRKSGKAIDVYELIDKIEFAALIDGVYSWEITEEFRGKENTYSVEGLEFELLEDEGMLLGNDMKDVIIGNMTGLSGIMLSSIKRIEIYPDNQIKLYFDDGTITIQCLE